jgi:hypothetical protein
MTRSLRSASHSCSPSTYCTWWAWYHRSSSTQNVSAEQM